MPRNETRVLSDQDLGCLVDVVRFPPEKPPLEPGTHVMQMTVVDFVKWMQNIETYCKFCKEHNLKRKVTPNSKATQKSAGSDYYKCSMFPDSQSAQKPSKRAKLSRGTKCKARIAVRFPLGYKHTESNEMNVDKFGDSIVRVQYTNDHTHEVYTSAAYNTSMVSKRAKEKIEDLRDQGFVWNDIKAAVEMRRHMFADPETWSMELFKINAYHLSYNERKIARMAAVNEENASRAKTEAEALFAQVLCDISSKPCSVQSDLYASISNFLRDTSRSIKHPGEQQT